MRNTRRYSAASAIVLAAMLAFSTGASAGPPWISVEIPSNPHHQSTRDALFLVHTYHHSAYMTVPVRATAEGLVDGKRRTLTARIVATNRAGVYAVRADLPADGTWLVAVRLSDDEAAPATALVTMDNRGRVAGVEVPSRTTRDGWVVPIQVTEADIDAALHAAVQVAAGTETANFRPATAGAAFIGLLALAGIIGASRRARA